MPAAYLRGLADLQEQAPAVPFVVARSRLEDVCICGSTGGRGQAKITCLHCRGLEGVFSSFEPEPVASASLAQVHRAVYSGHTVAVKFLKPGVLDQLNADLSLLERSSWILRRLLGVERNIPADEIIREFKRSLLDEVNLENEALNIERFRDTHPDTGPVRAPSVYWEFERADLLVLDFIDGTSLRRWDGTGDERRSTARIVAEDFIQQVFVDNFFHADPHPGNVFVQPEGHLVYLDFGAVGRLDRAARRALMRLFYAILNDDPDLAVDAVLQVGDTDRASVDAHDLRADIDRIIQLYRRRGGARWTDAVVQATRRHGLRLPRSILLYAKATMLNEALVKELDPGFEILPVARAMLAPIIESELRDRLARLRHDLPRIAEEYASVLRDLPDTLRLWMERNTETGED